VDTRHCQRRTTPVWMCATGVSVFSALPCIPGGFLCDGVEDCHDGSDESEAVCRPPGATSSLTTTTAPAAPTTGDDTVGPAPIVVPAANCTGKASTDGSACWCANDCHTCGLLGGEYTSCQVCKNAKVLVGGR
jgi:hypothetical protein